MADVLEERAVYAAWDAKRGALTGVDLDASFGPLRASVGGKGLRACRRGQPRDSSRGRDKSIKPELLPPRAASDQVVHLTSGFAKRDYALDTNPHAKTPRRKEIHRF